MRTCVIKGEDADAGLFDADVVPVPSLFMQKCDSQQQKYSVFQLPLLLTTQHFFRLVAIAQIQDQLRLIFYDANEHRQAVRRAYALYRAARDLFPEKP